MGWISPPTNPGRYLGSLLQWISFDNTEVGGCKQVVETNSRKKFQASSYALGEYTIFDTVSL